MSDLTARILEVVARLKGEAPPGAPPDPGPPPAPVIPPERPPGRSTLAELTRVLGLPLAQLDRVLRVAVPWIEVPLWFVPEEADVEALVLAGEATRGAVWTRGELLDFLTIPGLTKAGARTVAVAKLEFDGDVTEVRPVPARPESPAPGLDQLALGEGPP